jgi:predicted dehydrogenase
MFDSPHDTGRYFRLGVVGCGKAFERLHLKAISKSHRWQLAAAYDPLDSRRDWIEKQVPGIAVSKSFESLLEQHDLDAVLIAAPPEAHYPLGVQALAADLNVLVENPMALSAGEAMTMLQTSKRVNKRLIVGFNRRFRKPFGQLKERLAIIPPETIKSLSYRLIVNPDGWRPITAYLKNDGRGGGVLEDVVSHQADLMSWLLDAPVQKVSAKRLQGPDTDLIALELTFDKGQTTTCLAGHALTYDEKLVVEVGANTIMAHPAGVLQLRGRPSKWSHRYCTILQTCHLAWHKFTHTQDLTARSMASQWIGFADAIMHPNTPTRGCDAQGGVMSVNVIEACRRSLQNNGSWQSVDSVPVYP